MKTIARSASVATSLMVAGCVGTLDCIRSDRDLEAYADRLNLRNLPVEDAAAVLIGDGYQCEKKPPIAVEAAIVCTKQCRPYYGDFDRQLFIGLDPSDRGKGHPDVKWASITPA
jgi:hypothetical protein